MKSEGYTKRIFNQAEGFPAVEAEKYSNRILRQAKGFLDGQVLRILSMEAEEYSNIIL